jgi:hypothetical protein
MKWSLYWAFGALGGAIYWFINQEWAIGLTDVMLACFGFVFYILFNKLSNTKKKLNDYENKLAVLKQTNV